jgi:hypothetical protein
VAIKIMNIFSCVNFGYEFSPLQSGSEIPLDERRKISSSILRQYPDKIPIIIEPYSKSDPPLSYRKFLVPKDSDINAITLEIKEQIKIHSQNVRLNIYIKLPDNLAPQSSGFLFTPSNLKLLHSGLTVKNIYDRYRDIDGFLYLVYNVNFSIIASLVDAVTSFF